MCMMGRITLTWAARIAFVDVVLIYADILFDCCAQTELILLFVYFCGDVCWRLVNSGIVSFWITLWKCRAKTDICVKWKQTWLVEWNWGWRESVVYQITNRIYRKRNILFIRIIKIFRLRKFFFQWMVREHYVKDLFEKKRERERETKTDMNE